METIFIYLAEAKPKKKSKCKLKDWFRKEKEVYVCTIKPGVKTLTDVEYDIWNDETTYTFKYSL